MRRGSGLWDFVGSRPRKCACKHANSVNSHGFMRLIDCEFLARRWHAVCSLTVQGCYKKDWLPGVAGTQPRLSYRFLGGQFKERGGLHQPPFSSLGVPLEVVSLWFPWVVLFLSCRAQNIAPVFSFQTNDAARLGLELEFGADCVVLPTGGVRRTRRGCGRLRRADAWDWRRDGLRVRRPRTGFRRRGP